MRRLLLSALVPFCVYAADHDLYKYSTYIMSGYNANSVASGLTNDFYLGMRYNFNRSTTKDNFDIDAIQVSMDYTTNNAFKNMSKGIINGKTDLYRVGVNALWYFDNDFNYTPFVLAGVGTQILSKKAAQDNNNALFATVGGGVEYQLRGDFSVVGEVKDICAGEKDNYVTTGIGIKYSFGQDY